MTIITDNQSSRILAVGVFKEYWDNGYPIITDYNGYDTAYPTDFTTMYSVGEIPPEVVPEKFCYTPENGFYPNPNYREPNQYGLSDELVEQIKNDAITEVEEAVINADE